LNVIYSPVLQNLPQTHLLFLLSICGISNCRKTTAKPVPFLFEILLILFKPGSFASSARSAEHAHATIRCTQLSVVSAFSVCFANGYRLSKKMQAHSFLQARQRRPVIDRISFFKFQG
jgi:hypothetical protein